MLFQGGLGAAVKVAGEIDGMEDLDQPEPFANSMVHPPVSSLRGRLSIPHLRPDRVRMYTVKIVEPKDRRPSRRVSGVPHKIFERGGQLSPRVRVAVARSPKLLLDFKLGHRKLILFAQMLHRILFFRLENRVRELPRRMQQTLVPR